MGKPLLYIAMKRGWGINREEYATPERRVQTATPSGPAKTAAQPKQKAEPSKWPSI